MYDAPRGEYDLNAMIYGAKIHWLFYTRHISTHELRKLLALSLLRYWASDNIRSDLIFDFHVFQCEDVEIFRTNLIWKT